MRTLTAQQFACLQAEPGYSRYTRVRVLRGATWEDLSALTGLQLSFLEEVEVSESIEAPVAQATVRCAREVNGVSLAPLITTSVVNLVGGSYEPLLLEGSTFTVEAAVMPLGMDPESGDWMELFRGRIDEVDVGGEGLTFSGRDALAGFLQDTYIEEEREYGSGDPVLGDPVEDVMQAIINDNTASDPTLNTPVDPSWRLGKFVQKGESVMDALLALAAQLGWEVREKWYSGARQLVFWGPDRSATVPVWTFTAEDYEYLGQVRTSIEDVRNAVEVVYSDKDDLDAAGAPKRKTVLEEDSASIAEFGRRFMRIAEAASSNIDTSSEATTLAENALADLKDRPLGVQVEVPFHPGLELGDLVAVEGNRVHFTATQAVAVREVVHSFSPSTGGVTKLTLLGKPSTSVRRWLSMEQRPTTAPSSPFTGPDAPTGLASSETASGFRLRFDPPTYGPAATAYELHVSTSSGFTPSDSTRRVVGSLTEMVVTDLTPGTTYYAKVVPRDVKGNRGTASSQVTLVPRYVEPRTLQPQVTYAALPLNCDMEAWNDSSKPPDGWEMGTGTWSTDATVDTTKKASGGQSVRLENTAVATALRSAVFVCGQEDLVRCSAAIAVEGALGANTATLAVRWLDTSFAEVSTTTIATIASTGLSNFQTAGSGVTVAAPVGTRYAQLVVSKTTGGTYKTWVDSCRAQVEPGLSVTSAGFNFQNSFADATPSGSAGYLMDSEGFVLFEGAVSVSPTPATGTAIALLPTGFRPLQQHVFPVVSEGGTFGSVKVQTDGYVVFISGATATRLWLDGIRYRVLS